MTHFSALCCPLWRVFLLTLALAAALLPAAAQTLPPPAAQPSLAQALNPDGTLRPGARGAFDARHFRLAPGPNGQPAFRPTGPSGADDYRWQSGFGLPDGANIGITAVVQAGSSVYIGGYFNAVSDVAANGVARWDGTAWRALGSGLGNALGEGVDALAVAPNGDLYAAGTFRQAGSAAVNGLARWNGTAWSALGSGLNMSNRAGVAALAVAPNGNLYAAGTLNEVGGTAVDNIARWNGTAWTALGSGISTSGSGRRTSVSALAVAPNGTVYAGGFFDLAGGLPANNVARWDGSAWSALGTGTANGVNNEARALAVASGGNLYVGGRFSQAGGVPANGVARWNGSAWTALGAGLQSSFGGTSFPGNASALALAPNGDLYAGGDFDQAGNGAAHNIARWNGTTWVVLGTGVTGRGFNGNVSALAVANTGTVYVAGPLRQAGGAFVNGVARWNGAAWSTLGTGTGNGLNAELSAVALAPGGNVYVCGRFTRAGNVAANSVARWTGTAWAALGTGLVYDQGTSQTISTGAAYAMAVAPNGDLYVGGRFNRAGGVPANSIARWNGTAWSALGAGLQTTFGGGTLAPGFADALALAPNGDLYVGGEFEQAGTVAVTTFARWNGTAWNDLGAGLIGGTNDYVQALAVAANGTVYAGGRFAQASGPPALLIRRNGTTWSNLGGNFAGNDDEVAALALAPNGDLYAGGYFGSIAGVAANSIARWNGTAWNALGAGASGGFARVMALALAPNGDLYLGGGFEQAGTAAANIARWNGGSFGPLGSGLNAPVLALAVGPTGKVYAGGFFGAVGDGSKTSGSFAIYDPAAISATRPAALAALSLFPNPAHGSVTLRLQPGAAPAPLVLRDALGREVRRYPAPTAPAATLDLHGLPAGLYVLYGAGGSQRLVVE